MSVETVLSEVTKYLDSKNVSIDEIDFSKEEPVFKLSIKEYSDELMIELYQIFWTLTYGTVTEENRNNKIDIKYKLIEE